jgi:hypothetical protein
MERLLDFAIPIVFRKLFELILGALFPTNTHADQVEDVRKRTGTELLPGALTPEEEMAIPDRMGAPG